MTSLFKRFKKNLPSPTTKNSTYYKRENTIGNMDDLVRILFGGSDIVTFKTDKMITFNNIPLPEISFASLKAKFGNPAYVLKNEQVENHTVLFYRDSVSFYKFLIQYHFMGDEFFFATNKISTSGVLADSDKKKIIGRICKKYLDRDCGEGEGWLIRVIDPDGNSIHTLDDVYFHLYYLADNKTTRSLRKKVTGDTVVTKDRPSGFKESLDQYI